VKAASAADLEAVRASVTALQASVAALQTEVRALQLRADRGDDLARELAKLTEQFTALAEDVHHLTGLVGDGR
jgi:uncharacterized protein (DUF3084 family)